MNNLRVGCHFCGFVALITIILVGLFYRVTSKLGASINKLRDFAMLADRNEAIEQEMETSFPHNELGDISQHIIQIYKRLHDTKEDLYIEREKLFKHLQISHEGLGIFTKDKKEILVNNLFTPYITLISATDLETSDEVFDLHEFKMRNYFSNTQLSPTYTHRSSTMLFLII